MNEHQKRFIEDMLDLLNDLDAGLRQLEINPHAMAPLEQVFQACHTIRGGANMFGFENIGELCGHIEKLYDLVLRGKLQLSNGLIGITWNAFNRVRRLLSEREQRSITNPENLKDEHYIVKKFLKAVEEKPVTFFIRITPVTPVAETDNHPLVFIIQELDLLGTIKGFCYKGINEEVTHWDIFIATASSQTDIESHFMFVEKECQLTCTRLFMSDLLTTNSFMQYINKYEVSPVNISDLINFVNSNFSESII